MDGSSSKHYRFVDQQAVKLHTDSARVNDLNTDAGSPLTAHVPSIGRGFIKKIYQRGFIAGMRVA